MKRRISLKRTLLALAGVFCLPMSAASLPPFDTSDPTSRTVVIWIDNNVGDPSSVGQDLEFAFNGSWTSNGTHGTIVVDKDDVIAAFAISGLPGTPADTVNWSDMTMTITIATGRIGSISETGTLAIAGLGNQPFSYDLNTDFFDTITNNAYTQTGFANVTFGPETFTGWCTDTNAGQIAGLACPAYDGPSPFPYNSSTGRYNAIGATDLNSIIYAYSTFGEGQLFEEFEGVCGNGAIEDAEECDDSNTTPSDGCDESCQIETGWSCSEEPSVCSEICGDGLINGSETCDDGGTTPGDGCDSSCQIESSWSCSGEPSDCNDLTPSVPSLSPIAVITIVLGLSGLIGVSAKRRQ